MDIIQRIVNLKKKDEAWELLKSNLRDLEEPKNVLLVGSFGAGKSSFINTVITALTGKYDYYADIGCGSKHSTTRYKRITSRNYWNPEDKVDRELKLPTFIDIIGLDPQLSTSEEGRTINSQILNLVINGQLPENADLLDLGKKLKEGKLIKESTDAKTSAVDAIIAVISAENLNGAIPQTLIDEIYVEANMRKKQIPVFAVVTKIDKCDLSQDNLELKKNELCEAINITPDKLLLCSNYQPDPDLYIEKDIDILKFLIKVCSPHLQAVELEKIECESPPPIPVLAAVYNTIVAERYTYFRVQALKVAVAVLVVAFFLSLIMNLWYKMRSYHN